MRRSYEGPVFRSQAQPLLVGRGRARDLEIGDRRQRTERAMHPKNGIRRVQPGEVRHEELQSLDLSANTLAKALNVPVSRTTGILSGQCSVTADAAL